jgi:type VI secretion system protein VasD
METTEFGPAARRRRYAMTAAFCLVLAAAINCAKPPPPAPIVIPAPAAPTPTPTRMTIATSADTNPDATGRPSPIVLRVYQLKGDDAFNRAEFFALYDDDQKVLGAEMVSRQEFMLAPSASQTVELNVADDAQFVGAVAAFHDIRNAQWRVIVPAPRSGFTLSVERARLVVSATESN